MKCIKTKLSRSINGRYVVPVPWKQDPKNLPSQCYKAKKITTAMYQSSSEAVKEAIDATFQEWLDEGYMRPLRPDEKVDEGNYLTYFTVKRSDKPTTPYRVVVNAAQKFEKDGQRVSLNDFIHPGPKTQNSIDDIILNFRRRKVALTADVSRMFLQLRLTPTDQKYHRLWWKGVPYQLDRMPFGNRAAPYLANMVIRIHLQRYGTKLVRDQVIPNIYVDDLLVSFDDVKEAEMLLRDTIKVFATAKMTMAKWVTNDKSLWDKIPVHLRLQQAPVTLAEDTVAGVLGLKWDPLRDTFIFPDYKLSQALSTKRIMTSQMASIYDVTGILLPATLRLKTTLQTLCYLGKDLKLDWDTKLCGRTEPSLCKLAKEWAKAINQTQLIHVIWMPRKLTFEPEDDVQLHVFCDGSELAIAAVAYLRVACPDDHVSVSFVKAKRSVIPYNKKRSMPKIELSSAKLAAQMTGSLMKHFISIKVVCWTDNIAVYYWITMPPKHYENYVSSRLADIEENAPTARWRHVPTDINPADDPTRGISAAELTREHRWIRGPDHLYLPESQWPAVPSYFTQDQLLPIQQSLKSFQTLTCATMTVIDHSAITFRCRLVHATQSEPWLMTDDQVSAVKRAILRCDAFDRCKLYFNTANYSAFSRMCRQYAIVSRCTTPGRTTPQDAQATFVTASKKTIRCLTTQELFKSAMTLISLDQVGACATDLKHYILHRRWPSTSKLATMNAAFDTSGVLRIYGRLSSHTNIAGEIRHPIFLSRHGQIARLLVEAIHEDLGHNSGTRLLYHSTNKFFWASGMAELCKQVIKKCVECQKIARQPVSQKMADIPRGILSLQLKPFSSVSMDYAGPFHLKRGRFRTTRDAIAKNAHAKAYLLVVVCQQTKACHLDVTEDMTTDALLLALNRLTAERGSVGHVHTDNGSNFIMADRVLREMGDELELKQSLEDIDWQEIATKSPEFGIQTWSYSSPENPMANGLPERFVGLAKKALWNKFRTPKLSYEEFRTLVKRAECTINMRPIGTTLGQDNDVDVLTPMHFLVGRQGQVAPSSMVETKAEQLCERWASVNEAHRHFKQRWMDEILPMLHARSKWKQSVDDLKIGQVVLVVDRQRKRHDWPLGKVTNVRRCDDGKIREVEVRARPHPAQNMMIYKRSVRQIVPLSVFQEIDGVIPTC